MRYVTIALLLVCWPWVVLAQPVKVRTGEHADFTRVVVELPTGTGWTFGRSVDGYVLRLAGGQGYDLEKFFDLIPRRRITAVAQDRANGDLRLMLSCDCRADVFLSETGFVVIDIANGEPDPGSPFERAIDAPAVPAVVQSLLLPVLLPRQAPPQVVLPFGAAPAPWTNVPVQPVMSDDLRALERLVMESLGQGLSAGALDPDLASATTAPQRLPQVPADTALPGLAVRNGMDLAAVPVADPPVVNADGVACAPDGFVDLARWADAQPFAIQLARQRAALVQEFDRFDPDAVVALARLYLHFGFGREAIAVLGLDGAGSRERSYLRFLAQVIDDDPVRFSAIDEQLTCPSQIALWAFLAMPHTDASGDYDRDAVLRTFKDLPQALQQHLGPRLAERFSARADADAARQALAPAQLVAPEALETRLAAATLAEGLGDQAASLLALTRIAQTDPRVTSEAMTRYLTETVRQNRQVPQQDMISADAVRFEQALSPAAGALTAAQIEAYLAADDFAQAADLLHHSRTLLGPDRFADLRQAYGLAAVARMPDADFLAFVFSESPPPDAFLWQQQAAQRLIALGFPDQALLILAAEESVAATEDRRHLQARALLELRDPEAVMRLLRADRSDQADDLRRAARALQAGNSTALANIAMPDNVENNWRNGDWASLAQVDDPVVESAAAAMLDRVQSGFDQDRPLASGRAVLDQAAQSRALFDGLMERFQRPDEF